MDQRYECDFMKFLYVPGGGFITSRSAFVDGWDLLFNLVLVNPIANTQNDVFALMRPPT